jgi:epsilon-lactone hydrolase
VRMAVVHDVHHHGHPDTPMMDAMDDLATRTGKVLVLPPAPDAIELRHLRAFVAVAEELNFGRAATRLYLSQPALSRQVRGLERLVGCDLLRRSTHRVELTLAGEALLDRARRLLTDLDDAVQATRSVGGDLERRLAAAWEPISDLTAAAPDLQALRDACERLHGQFEMAPGVAVRPVIAGGVTSLLLGPRPQEQPTVLLLHGGGGVMGSAFGYRHLASALAAAADTGVVVPDFRLAPEHPFPAALEDALRTYVWMLDSGVPPERIVVAGDSFGGGLALSLQTTLKRQDLPLPGGSLLFCPGIDLGFRDDVELPDEPQPAVSLAQLRSFGAAYLGDTSPDDEVVNALRADLTGQPPMLIQAGTGDLLGKDAHRLAEHARGCGVDVAFELYSAATHDFQVFWSFLPEASDALEQAGAFVRRIQARAARGDGGQRPRLGRSSTGTRSR